MIPYTFLSSDAQMSVLNDIIRRTRKQCMYWSSHINSRHAGCDLNQNKRCRPVVCPNFRLIVTRTPL